jgi:hypothetical protein
MNKHLFLLFLPNLTISFTVVPVVPQHDISTSTTLFQANEQEVAVPFFVQQQEEEKQEKQSSSPELDPEIASQFKILTCSSTACTKKKISLGLDEYALYSGLYGRKEGGSVGASEVIVEESSCLGCCKFAPCVGIEHEDYFGMVGLEGMSDNELNDSVFQNIVTEDDLDRVWSSVENAIQQMMEEEDEE